MKLKLNHKKNLLRALMSAIIIEIPFLFFAKIDKIILFLFIILFIGIFVGCSFIDLIYKYMELKKIMKNGYY